ncbi:MAG: GNAT family N-acetyltransferase [Phototrophicaceae bacterium]
MIFGSDDFVLRKASEIDLTSIKEIADENKKELGFINRGTIIESIKRYEVAIVESDGYGIVGFIHYRHRLDSQTTLYNLAVKHPFRNCGMGRRLIEFLKQDALASQKLTIRLKCPEELASNQFYERYGFKLMSVENGKHRRLNIWVLNL